MNSVVGESKSSARALPANPRRHMAEGAIRVFLAEALLLPTGLLTAAFLTRKLAPDGYGLFTVAASVVAWIEWTITATFSRTTFKLIAEAEDWKPLGAALVRWHLIVGLASAAALWFLSAPAAQILNAPALAGYLRFFAIDIPIFSLAQAHRGILVGIGQYRERAVVTAVRWLTRLFLVLLFVQIGFSINGAIAGSIGASLLELACARFYVRPSIFARLSVRVSH